MKYCFDIIKPKYYDSIKKYRSLMIKNGSSFDGCFLLKDYDDIEEWDYNVKLFEQESTLPPGYSISYEYLYLDENKEVVGMIDFRPDALIHTYLKEYGGHIGYSVRPDKRNKGIGNNMLKEFLIICKNKYNIERVLITCFEDNEYSRKIIINNGGIFDRKTYYAPENKHLERYFVDIN